MYELIKKNIKASNYELNEMTQRINRFAAAGKITPDEQDELLMLAQNNADMSKGYASLEKRIMALEVWKEEIEAQGGKLPEAGGEDEEYPAWVQPTHAGNAYYNGAKMTYTDGVKYECVAPEGYGVTYGPDVLPNMWVRVEE